MDPLRRLIDIPTAIRRNISMPIDHALVGRRPGDQYIAAYPRSGSTWLRTMLCTLLDPEKGFEPAVFNERIPGVDFRNLRKVWALQDPRLMFSHSMFRPSLGKTVYVVRDGRDSLVSLYHMYTNRERREMPFPAWFDHYCRRGFGPRWDNHVESWLIRGQQRLGDKLLVVRFEDLKQEPVAGLQKIAEFLGLRTDLESISWAVDMARTEKARERERAELGRIDDPNASFYRGGKTGQWKEYMDDAIYSRFMKLSARAMQLAGYSS
jgi:hypothetical protein